MKFRLSKILKILPNIGHLTFATFVICVISGIIIAFKYEPSNAYFSISQILLFDPLTALIRSIHYWSAQFFFVLIILHIIDHLQKKSEQKIKEAIWLKLIITIPFIFYAMFSGFLLRNDVDAQQAKNITETVIRSIPLLGDLLKNIFLGNNNSLIVIYVNHIATVTIFIWLITIDHSKKIFPFAKFIVISIMPIIIISFFLIPTINLPETSIIKGPWYFVGVQEFLHWINEPLIFVILSLILLIIFYLIIKIKKQRKRLIILISVFSILYLFLTVIGHFFRGKNWEFVIPFITDQKNPISFTQSNIFSDNSVEIKSNVLPTINGKVESCIMCHSAKGMVASHDLSILGCYSCHSGNPLTIDKDLAHKNLILIPGNLSNAKRTCGQIACHPNIVDRVNLSLMNTMSGIIAVDKWVFDENKDLNQKYNINEISNTPAEKHLKNLCASCHLSKEKKYFGEITENSRGGGCNACHLQYDNKSLASLKKFKNDKNHILDSNYYHPKLTINTDNRHCFGCHSRSGRISLSYEGWHETKLEKLVDSSYRKLLDGRILKPEKPDIHYQKGMICIDCHISYEIMGDGKLHSHKEEQIYIDCQDCHSLDTNKFTTYQNLDYETQRIVDIRNLNVKNRRFLQTKYSNKFYSNVFVQNDTLKVFLKKSQKILIAKSPSKKCGINIQGHQKINCESCHNNWSPHCIGCHTQYDPQAQGFDNLKDKKIKGTWLEYDGEYLTSPATLGVDDSKEKRIKSFIPGMILTIEGLNKKIFKRLYAPAFSHTIQKKTRNCQQCHFDPLAIGYGRGKLEFDKQQRKIYFTPYYEINKNDFLPEDAWVGFLNDPKPDVSTRKFHRPFNKKEQEKILNIGVCFQCHKESENNFLKIFFAKDNWKSKMTKNCILLFQ